MTSEGGMKDVLAGFFPNVHAELAGHITVSVTVRGQHG
jgi:hypothetical protein